MSAKSNSTPSEDRAKGEASPPRLLGEHGHKFWAAVVAEYQITDTGGREILRQCCAALDRAEELRARIDQDGPVVLVQGIAKENPLLKHELACRAFVTRCIQRLGLDVPHSAYSNLGRPPRGIPT
jgi:hypothetical protein